MTLFLITSSFCSQKFFLSEFSTDQTNSILHLNPIASVKSLTSYTPHPTIDIDLDSDFGPSVYDFNGSGTINDPYRIEDFNITEKASNLIDIQDTTVYFKISNCWLRGNNFIGIRLRNIKHAIIENNIINNCSDGIKLDFANSNITIKNNTCEYNTNYGVNLGGSDNNTIQNNTIRHNDNDGLLLLDSENNTIINNTITNNRYGVYLDGDGAYLNLNRVINNTITNHTDYGINVQHGNDTIITNNTISHNSKFGINLRYGENNTITRNTILYHTSMPGISVSYMSNCTFVDNTLSNNRYGIKLEGYCINHTISNNSISNSTFCGLYLESNANNTRVTWNEFYYNYLGSRQAEDHGENNTFCFNYWNEWTNDSDYDGFTNPYPLRGSTYNNDSCPRAYPYRKHGPIEIWQDSDFETLRIPGQGTSEEPYLIENYYFNESTIRGAIFIKDTTKYFIIRNNVITGGDIHNGLWLQNVADENISNNLIHRSYVGICIDSTNLTNIQANTICYNNNQGISSSYCNHNYIRDNIIFNNTGSGLKISEDNNSKIYGNNISNHSHSGIWLTNCQYTDVQHNEIFDNEINGFYIYDSSYNTLKFNNIHDNEKMGIHLWNKSYSNDIWYNNFTRNSEYGIYLYDQTSNNSISNNSISFNQVDGIYFYKSSYNNISFNEIVGNSQTGIHFTECSEYNNIFGNTIKNHNHNGISLANSNDNIFTNNTIHLSIQNGIIIISGSNNKIQWNNFLENNVGGKQASDSGTSNTVTKNYWNEWRIPDTNTDGFVDGYYGLWGTTDNKDLYPLITPVLPILYLHYLTTPVVLSPNGGETLSGAITIHWYAAIDSKDHPVTYEVYYSSDGGTTWNLISADLTSHNFNWDTTSVTNGANYFIKVEANCSTGLSKIDTSDSPFSVQNIISTTTTATTTTITTTTATASTTTQPSSVTTSTSATSTSTSGPQLESPYNWNYTLISLLIVTIFMTIKRRKDS